MKNTLYNREFYKPREPEKLIAERINGWFEMFGFIAAIGAYVLTGQLIPGFM